MAKEKMENRPEQGYETETEKEFAPRHGPKEEFRSEGPCCGPHHGPQGDCGCGKRGSKILLLLLVFFAGMGFNEFWHGCFRCPTKSHGSPTAIYAQMPAYSDAAGTTIIINAADGMATMPPQFAKMHHKNKHHHKHHQAQNTQQTNSNDFVKMPANRKRPHFADRAAPVDTAKPQSAPETVEN